MISTTRLNLFALGLLVACASTKTSHVSEVQHFAPTGRAVAEMDASNGEHSLKKVNKTLKGIFHSYILGQVLLKDFDRALDQDSKNALESEIYSQLLAIRVLVDQFEHEIDESYVQLVMVSSLPNYSEEQKDNARKTLKTIGAFMDGLTTDNKELPENLKHLVLGNLREKQTVLYDRLKAIQADATVTDNLPHVISGIEEHMVSLRATRMKYFKAQKAYEVDEAVLQATVKELSQDSDFKAYRSEVKKMSKEIRKITKEFSQERSTSSDSIYPNAGKAGNVTGRGYPANTWSITYDDGPGGKTTPTVLKNLKAKDLKATFFMLARQVEALPATAKAVVDAGMDIACHSYDHAQLTKVGPAALERQIGGAKKIIETKLEKKMKLFRLPYGAGVSVAAIRAKIAEHNMIHVFWNVDTLDWQDKNPASIVRRAQKQMAGQAKNNGVILFHDIHPQSVIASAALMDEMKKSKIKICTVQSVIDQINEGRSTCE